jgi:hypothetical protein
MNIDPDILDESWIYNFKNEESEYNDFYKEKPTSVKLYFMYINREKIIDIIKTEQFLLNDKAKIEKEHLISIIKKYQVCYNTKYKLLSLLKFNIDLEPNDVISNTFITLTDTKQPDSKYMTTEHYIEDIHFKDTVCIFHDINSLFFIYYERNDNINHKPTNTTKKIVFNTNYRKTVKKRV